MKKQLEQAYTPAKTTTNTGGKDGKALVPPAYDVAAPGLVSIQRKKKEDDDLKKKKPLQRKAKEEDLKKKKPVQRKKKEDDLKKKKPLQRKVQPSTSSLPIDAPDSPLEKEADAVAEQIVRRLSASSDEKSTPLTTTGISRSAAGSASGGLYAPAHVASALETAKGQGQPLPNPLRTEMEGVIGSDLSGVRIHTDAKAAELSEAVNAQAFTYGQDVYFNVGKYQPGTVDGRRLLGHEVGHVGQLDRHGKIGSSTENISKSFLINGKGIRRKENIPEPEIGFDLSGKEAKEFLYLPSLKYQEPDLNLFLPDYKRAENHMHHYIDQCQNNINTIQEALGEAEKWAKKIINLQDPEPFWEKITFGLFESALKAVPGSQVVMGILNSHVNGSYIKKFIEESIKISASYVSGELKGRLSCIKKIELELLKNPRIIIKELNEVLKMETDLKKGLLDSVLFEWEYFVKEADAGFVSKFWEYNFYDQVKEFIPEPEKIDQDFCQKEFEKMLIKSYLGSIVESFKSSHSDYYEFDNRTISKKIIKEIITRFNWHISEIVKYSKGWAPPYNPWNTHMIKEEDVPWL